MNPHESFETRIVRAYSIAWERYMVQRFEEHLGRVPTNDEVATLGHCNVWPTGARDLFWAGKKIGDFPDAWEWAKSNMP